MDGLLQKIITILHGKRHSRMRQNPLCKQEPVFTVILNDDGWLRVRMDTDSMCYIALNQKGDTINGHRYTVDRNQKELFRIVER